MKMKGRRGGGTAAMGAKISLKAKFGTLVVLFLFKSQATDSKQRFFFFFYREGTCPPLSPHESISAGTSSELGICFPLLSLKDFVGCMYENKVPDDPTKLETMPCQT